MLRIRRVAHGGADRRLLLRRVADDSRRHLLSYLRVDGHRLRRLTDGDRRCCKLLLLFKRRRRVAVVAGRQRATRRGVDDIMRVGSVLHLFGRRLEARNRRGARHLNKLALSVYTTEFSSPSAASNCAAACAAALFAAVAASIHPAAAAAVDDDIDA